MIQGIDINKIIDLALKYRIQLTFIGILFLFTLSFHLGKNSVVLPDKATICAEHNILIGKYRDDLKECIDDCDDRIDRAIDIERQSCDLKIINAIQQREAQNQITNCRIAKEKARQCKGR